MTGQTTNILQSWLKTVIVSPGFLDEKLNRARRIYSLQAEDLITAHPQATMHRRLNVYTSGYLARLLECMNADYEVLRKFTGDEVFESFAKAYLLYHPSQSFTLYDLGNAFPDFLDKTIPKATTVNTADDFMGIPIALARLERARQEAMRAMGTENDEISKIEISIDDVLFKAITTKLPACLTLLKLAYPMKDFYDAVDADRLYELPQPMDTYMAISRKNYRVTITELSHTQFVLLKNCKIQGGFYKAVSETAIVCGVKLADILADCCIWLPMLSEKGVMAIEAQTLI